MTHAITAFLRLRRTGAAVYLFCIIMIIRLRLRFPAVCRRAFRGSLAAIDAVRPQPIAQRQGQNIQDQQPHLQKAGNTQQSAGEGAFQRHRLAANAEDLPQLRQQRMGDGLGLAIANG